jgi:hypothetical protein
VELKAAVVPLRSKREGRQSWCGSWASLLLFTRRRHVIAALFSRASAVATSEMADDQESDAMTDTPAGISDVRLASVVSETSPRVQTFAACCGDLEHDC